MIGAVLSVPIVRHGRTDRVSAPEGRTRFGRRLRRRVIESLIQGAWLREYHEWEKATKGNFGYPDYRVE